MPDVREDAIVLLSDLIGFPTVTSESNLELIASCQAQLEKAGARTRLTHDASGTKANLLATIGPDVSGGVVLSGHTDVVPADPEGWTTPPFVASLRSANIYGRGSADMKGFIACVLAMAPHFAAAGLRRPVHVALTFDEEVGCLGAPLLIEQLLEGPTPAAAIIGEPTELAIVSAHKGCNEYTTVVTGVEGHASGPARGVNAVECASRFVERLRALSTELAARAPDDSPFDPPETTLSVGTISGGTARNVIAGTCEVGWELRPVCAADAEHAATRIKQIETELREEMRSRNPDAQLETFTVGEVEGLEPHPGSSAISLTSDLLDNPIVKVVPFGTEAGLYQRAGIPAVVCGPGSIEVAHQPDEHISLAQLDACLGMLDRLTERLR